MDLVSTDGKPVGPAHLFGAEIGLAKSTAAHRLAQACVFVPAPGVVFAFLGDSRMGVEGRCLGLCAAPLQLSSLTEVSGLGRRRQFRQEPFGAHAGATASHTPRWGARARLEAPRMPIAEARARAASSCRCRYKMPSASKYTTSPWHRCEA